MVRHAASRSSTVFHGKTMPIRIRFAPIALIIASASVAACSTHGSANDPVPSKRMADRIQWTTNNLNVNTDRSYCYEDAELNCRRYGRLYTWESAQIGCRSLGDGWRLPTDNEWRQMAKHYGGVREHADDSGKAAYTALLIGGRSGLNALLGGDRNADDRLYTRLQAHGFYWTASESKPTSAWFYNFGQGGLSLNRHSDGDKQMAVSVRCVRD